jgi:hypothetical protein
VTLRHILFYFVGLLVLLPIPRQGNHPLFAVSNISAAILCHRGDILLQQTLRVRHMMSRDPSKLNNLSRWCSEHSGILSRPCFTQLCRKSPLSQLTVNHFPISHATLFFIFSWYGVVKWTNRRSGNDIREVPGSRLSRLPSQVYRQMFFVVLFSHFKRTPV